MPIQPKNKKYYFFAAAFAVAVFFLVYGFCHQNDKDLEIVNTLADTPQACFEKTCFAVEIADTAYKQKMGLMNRKSLEKDKGMLFIFAAEDKYKFWMKNTLIPLDIIWIDKNNKIIFIQKNAQPCKTEQCESFGPDENAKYVLEINGGLAENIGLEIGDELETENWKLEIKFPS